VTNQHIIEIIRTEVETYFVLCDTVDEVMDKFYAEHEGNPNSITTIDESAPRIVE